MKDHKFKIIRFVGGHVYDRGFVSYFWCPGAMDDFFGGICVHEKYYNRFLSTFQDKNNAQKIYPGLISPGYKIKPIFAGTRTIITELDQVKTNKGITVRGPVFSIFCLSRREEEEKRRPSGKG